MSCTEGLQLDIFVIISAFLEKLVVRSIFADAPFFDEIA